MKVYCLLVVLAVTCHYCTAVPSPFYSESNEQVNTKICRHRKPSEGFLNCLGANSSQGFANLKRTLNSCGRNHADSFKHMNDFVKDLCKGDARARGYTLGELNSCLGHLQGKQGSPPVKEPLLSTAAQAERCVSGLYSTYNRHTGKKVN